MRDLSYSVVSTVLHTWEVARQQYSSEEEIGTEILLRLFKLQPEAQAIFGLLERRVEIDDVVLRKEIRPHGIIMVCKIDSALAMLGPESDMVDYMVGKLAERHLRMGVAPHHLQSLDSAVMWAMKDVLGPRVWTQKTQTAFAEVFGEFSRCMAETMHQLKTMHNLQ